MAGIEVSPEVVVGLYLQRGVDFVVAQLASLKAGAAYLPLDSANPPARTEEMLRAAGASILLTSAVQRGRIGNGALDTVTIDEAGVNGGPDDDQRLLQPVAAPKDT